MSERAARYLVCTPINEPLIVAGICALHEYDVYVFPLSFGVGVYREKIIPPLDEWDIRNITGEGMSGFSLHNEVEDPSDDMLALTTLLSNMTPYGAICAYTNISTDGFDEGIHGTVNGFAVEKGEVEEIPMGLLLQGADPLLEKVLLGHISLDELDAIHTTEMSAEDFAQIERMMKKTTD